MKGLVSRETSSAEKFVISNKVDKGQIATVRLDRRAKFNVSRSSPSFL